MKWTLIERVLGARVLRVRDWPQGSRPELDIKRHLPNFRVSVVFDVGANVGQSAEHFVDWFASAEVFCFEPVSGTYDELSRRMAAHPQVRCYRIAMGASAGEGSMTHGHASDLSSLSRSDPQLPLDQRSHERVDVRTVDLFCADMNIPRISYLKVDTEGHDLEVLKGAERMLRGHLIDAVEVEAGMNPSNRVHVSLEALKSHLEERGYLLFAIYEQMHEWPTGAPHLRRANLVFASPALILANTRGAKSAKTQRL